MASFSGLPYLYKEGTLTKRQRAQHHKNNAKLKFQERYFQLKGENLDYYDPKKKLSAPAKGSFHMSRALIVEPIPYGIFKKSNMFQVGDNVEVLYMVATSEFERESWIKALRQCCSDCGNKMLFKFHPGAFGLTAKNHWSCCGGARDATGCSMCSKVPEQDQPEPQPEPQPPDKPSIKLPEKQPEKQRKEIVTLTSSSSTREDPKPEPHVMYLNPLTEPPTTETKSNDVVTKKRHSATSLDSGNGTGSTSSSRPQSQIIPDPHGTPNSDSPALLQKPQEKPKETVEILPEKLNSVPEVNDIKMNDVNPVSDKEESSEIEVSHGSDDKPVDIKTVTNDTAEAIPADTGSNTIEAKASDKETSQDVTDGGIATDTIGDIVEDKVTEKEAWQDIDRTNTPPIVVTPELPQKKSTEKIDFKSDFDDIDNNDDVFTELPDLRRPSQIINPSSSPRPSALLNSPVGMSSPVNLSPRPGRRSSFSVNKVIRGKFSTSTSNPLTTNKDGFAQLHLACKNGDTAAIQSEIDMGADIEMATSGTTPHKPIFLAFLHDHYQALEYLLLHCGANPDSTESSNGGTLLHWACERGNFTVMQLLISSEAEINKTDWKGNTPLHEACKHGHLEISSFLIEHGAEVNSTGCSKRTPLHEAAQHGHYEITKLLLDKNAKTDIRETIENHTPAELAYLNKHHEVYNLLAPSPEEDGVPYESLHTIATGYPEGIASMCFSDGNMLVTGSKDHQVGFWDIVGAECKRTVQLDNTILSIAAQGTFVAVGSTTIQLLSSSMEAWRRSVLDTDEDYEAIVEDLALHVVGFTPNGHLVTADVEDEEASIKLWPVLSENLYLRTCQKFFSAAVDGKSTTYAMVVSQVPDSHLLATVIQPGSLFHPKGNKLIRIFDWMTCKCIQTIDTGHGGFDVEVIIQFSTVTAEELAVACQGTIKVYNSKTAEVIASFSSTKGASVTSLAYSTNGRQLCAGLESGTVQVFNLTSRAQQFVLETQTTSISCMEYSPDGNFLAMGAANGDLQIWQTKPNVSKA